VLAKARAVPGVAAAEPVLEGTAVIVGSNGKPISGLGLREAGTWITDATLNPWHLVAGAAPQGTDEVVIDQAAATAAGLSVGRRTTVQLPEPVTVTVSGIADFGTQPSAGEGTYTAFSLAGAQKYIAGAGTCSPRWWCARSRASPSRPWPTGSAPCCPATSSRSPGRR
jgi:putative ABC transport system permease protein